MAFFLARIADRRRDIWPSSEEALHALRLRPGTRTWDERVLKILVVSFASLSLHLYMTGRREQEHGVRPLPTAEYPDLKEGVTLKCTKKQVAVSD